MNPLTLAALVTEREFLVGLGWGIAALTLTLGTRGRLGWFGPWAAAASAGLAWTGWLGGFVAAPAWALLPALAVVTVGTAGAKAVERAAGGLPLVTLFALMVLGVWGTVPDTEGARVLMGVTAGLAPAALPWTRAGASSGVSPSGIALALAVTCAVALADGVGRPGSIVGALGCAGMLLVLPIAARLRASLAYGMSGRMLVGAQVGLVILSGRIAGTQDDPTRAATIWVAAAILVGAAWAGAELLGRRSSRP